MTWMACKPRLLLSTRIANSLQRNWRSGRHHLNGPTRLYATPGHPHEYCRLALQSERSRARPGRNG